MNSSFPRIITLLRKERGLSQKAVAAQLGISQALLSHYEKGIRECGLDFLVLTADFYGVSCDYLLGRTNDRTGALLTFDDIPEPEAAGKDNRLRGSMLPMLNKKLIANSLNILFDKLQKTNNKALTNEMTLFLMISVYRMIRIANSGVKDYTSKAFSISELEMNALADAYMNIAESRANMLMQGATVKNEKIDNPESMNISFETLSQDYPLFASSLLSLIKSSETAMEKIK